MSSQIQVNNSFLVKYNKSRLSNDEIIERVDKNREKALQRYYENKDKCKEQTKQNQKRYMQVYRIFKQLVKEGKIELPLEDKDHLKELLCLN